MAEMMIPTADLGTTHVLHDVTYRKSSVIYRVTSAYDNNTIRESTGANVTLNQGEFKDYDLQALQTELCVFSDQPVMTLMFTKGNDSDPNVTFGDPSMTLVPPVQGFTNEYVINMDVKPGSNFVRSVAVVMAKGTEAGMILPGSLLEPSLTPSISIACGYSVTHVTLNASSHWLRHRDGASFGAVLYASGSSTGLSTLAGLALSDKQDTEMGQASSSGNQGTAANRTGYRDTTQHTGTPANQVAEGQSADGTGTTPNMLGYQGTTSFQSIPETSRTQGNQTVPGSQNLHRTQGTLPSQSTSEYQSIPSSTPNSIEVLTAPTGPTVTNPGNKSGSQGIQEIPGPQSMTGSTHPVPIHVPELITPATSGTTILQGTERHRTRTVATPTRKQSAIGISFSQVTPTTQAIMTTTEQENYPKSLKPSRSKRCPCICASLLWQNETLGQLLHQAEQQAKHLKTQLTVNASQLSRSVRKVSSASDSRLSASGIGYVGVAVLVFVLGIIVFIDVSKFCYTEVKIQPTIDGQA